MLSLPTWLTHSGQPTHKWSPFKHRTGTGQGKSAGHTPISYALSHAANHQWQTVSSRQNSSVWKKFTI